MADEQQQRSRVVRESLQPCSDEFHRRSRTWEEWEALVTNIREWPGQDQMIAECHCGSTLSWNILPSRFDENDDGPEQRARKRKNPYKGKGRQSYFVPLASLSDEEIESLPRSAFNDEEWSELPASQQEKIWQHPESQERVDALVEFFQDTVDTHSNPPEEWMLPGLRDSFHDYLRQRADELVDDADEDEVNKIIERFAGDFPRDQVRRAISRALGDMEAYDHEMIGPDESQDHFHTETYYDEEFSIEASDLLKKIMKIGMYEDEFHQACLKINKDMPDVWRGILRTEWPWPGFDGPADDAPVDEKDGHKPALKRLGYVYGHVTIEQDFAWDPDWRRVYGTVDTILEREGPLWEDFEDSGAPEQDTRPEEERVVHRFSDGFYVLELTPTDMKAEGEEQGHCIGDPGQGFVGAVRNKRGKAWSIRTASGRPKLSIFAGLDKDGQIVSIEQVKGKANRLVGWDLRKVGGGAKLKEHEVIMAVEFIKTLGVNPLDVGDLLPALSRMKEINPSWYSATLHNAPIPPASLRGNPARSTCPSCGGPRSGFCAQEAA